MIFLSVGNPDIYVVCLLSRLLLLYLWGSAAFIGCPAVSKN